MAAEKPPKPKVRQKYIDNISDLQDSEDLMVIGKDSFGSGDIVSGVRNLASQPPKTNAPHEVYAKVIGVEDNPHKAAQVYMNTFRTEPDDDLRYVYKVRADLHQGHLQDPSKWPEDSLKHQLYLSLHPDAITSPEYADLSQIPLGADVVCEYKYSAKREGLYIARVDDTDANAGAISSDLSDSVLEGLANTLTALFNSGIGVVNTVKSMIGMKVASSFQTPSELKLTSEQENALGAVVRRLILPDAVRFSSKFGTRIHPRRKTKKMHRGCDFACGGKSGARILTPKAGAVKRSYGRWTGEEKAVHLKLGGNQVVVDHLDGTKSYFLHMEDVVVAVGQNVKAGEKLGTMGNTGIGTGPHLHYGVKDQGTFVDPIPMLVSWFNGGENS